MKLIKVGKGCVTIEIMYLVFDIGGTNIRAGISSDGQNVSASKVIPRPEDFTHGIAALQKTAAELAVGQKIEKVAGGIAGVLDKEKNGLAKSANIPSWTGRNLKEELQKMFGCGVLLENDAAVEALGESIKGPGAGKGICAYISIGTGIGSNRIVDGKLDRNALGFESGHQIIVPDGNPCNCGGKGHLESYVGGSYLEKIYGKKGEDIKDPEIWDEISRYLAIGLTNVSVHWSPDIIILGGSVSQSIPLGKTQDYLNDFLTVFPKAPQVVKATLGHEAGLYGALELLKW